MRMTSTFSTSAATTNGVLPSSARAVTSAPCLMRRHATSTLPQDDATCNGVHPLLSRAVTSAPCSTRKRVTSTCPFFDAACNEVFPSLSRAITSAPCSTRIRATSTCPSADATCSLADLSSSPRDSTFCAWSIDRNFAIPCRPQTVAYCDGVSLGGNGFSARPESISGFPGSCIHTQIPRCGFFRSKSSTIPSSTHCDTFSNRACSNQCRPAYSARG